MQQYYEYRHVVGFEETNLVGNVYFTNHLKWQGRCRELFLRDHAPEVLEALSNGLCLVTARCTCDYLQELAPFNEVVIRMKLGSAGQNRIVLLFDYWRSAPTGEELVARGEQHVVSMKRVQDQALVPTPLPVALIAALRRFG
jgi:enediyne biosynthesis thioesterase